MTTYVRLDAEGAIERHLDLTPEQYAALVANGKAAWLRLWIEDPFPVPSATQVIVDAGIVITSTEARQTWALRDKTPSELEADAILADRAKIEEIFTSLTAQRAVTREQWDGYTAAQLRSEQWRDRQVLLRFAHFLARRVRREP